MDLTTHVPRSPYAELGGYTWLPRIIDKAKAQLADTLGEYNYDCPMDKLFLEAVGVSGDDFLAAVKTHQSDDAILAWLNQRAPLDEAAKQQLQTRIANHKPGNEKSQAYFNGMLAAVAPGRTDVQTWAHVIALDEKHPEPAVR